MKTNLKMLWVAALFSLVSGGSLAGPVGPLTTFNLNTPAIAAEVEEHAHFALTIVGV